MESEIRQFLLCCGLRILGFYCEEVRVYGFFDTFLLFAPCNVGSFCVSDLTYFCGTIDDFVLLFGVQLCHIGSYFCLDLVGPCFLESFLVCYSCFLYLVLDFNYFCTTLEILKIPFGFNILLGFSFLSISGP